MNLDRDDIDLEEILFRYFRQELKSAEKAEIDDWRNLNKENQLRFDELRIMYLDLRGLNYYQNAEVQADESWEEFKKENKVRSINSAPVRSSAFLKYAASILIVASAAFGIYYVQNRPESLSIAAIDDIQELTLPDASTISLNAGSTIAYKEPFQNNERRVSLKGEAYFEVTKVLAQPFVIQVGDAEIRVLGTKFFIQENEDLLHVQVDEGKVLISYGDLHEIVEAGSSVNLNLKEESLVEPEDNTGLNTFWKNRKLVFNLTSLEEVVATVNQAYGTSIHLDGKTEGCSLTVTFDNESIENVLEIISNTLDYEVKKDQKTYFLKGDGCQ